MNADVEEAIARLDGFFREYIGVSESSWKTIRQTAVRLVTEIARLRSELEATAKDVAQLREVEPMAACMDHLRDELVRAEIIGAEVPPMFYPEVIAKIARKLDALQAMIDNAPRAIMDTRVALGLCAPTEADFPALYALQGKSVALLVLDETNTEATK